MLKSKVLLVDDDASVRAALSEFLQSQDYEITEVGSCDAAQEAFRTFRPDAAIMDYSLPDGTALDLLPNLKALYPSVPLILLTGQGSIELAVRAVKEGAEQFLTKPVQLSTVAVVLERALTNQRNLQKQLAGSSAQNRKRTNPFIGSSPAARQLCEQAERVAHSDYSVLLTGETGSGKGVLARWLHDNSARSEEAFVDLNCAGFPRELLESELFGYEQGAFTGAVKAKPGLFEFAHRGTVFLDEIGDMDLQLQPKLLKVLEERRFRRLGNTRERQSDVRLVAATHQDLKQLVRNGKFRSDLYFRIGTIIIRMPALRERALDIPELAAGFLEQASIDVGRPKITLSDDAIFALQRYDWPGNIRELKNIIERASLLSRSDTISARDLHLDHEHVSQTKIGGTHLTLRELERAHIQHVLAEEKGNMGRTAHRLGIARSSLYSKLKTLGIASGLADAN
ncbi:MAG: sigma-54 dependent transcriptional regulator [Candidatus Sulfotelmatobacter sp.]|jgi:DNA-binding NtrC family response regulator